MSEIGGRGARRARFWGVGRGPGTVRGLVWSAPAAHTCSVIPRCHKLSLRERAEHAVAACHLPFPLLRPRSADQAREVQTRPSYHAPTHPPTDRPSSQTLAYDDCRDVHNEGRLSQSNNMAEEGKKRCKSVGVHRLLRQPSAPDRLRCQTITARPPPRRPGHVAVGSCCDRGCGCETGCGCGCGGGPCPCAPGNGGRGDMRAVQRARAAEVPHVNAPGVCIPGTHCG